jgi:hypothetical protein
MNYAMIHIIGRIVITDGTALGVKSSHAHAPDSLPSTHFR